MLADILCSSMQLCW